VNEYELKIYDEVANWKREIVKPTGIMKRISKKAQGKINGIIPEKVHQIMSDSIKVFVKTTLFGSNVTTNKNQAKGLTLAERDELVRQKTAIYQKTALIEGAGTGAGGILLGLADFPMLLSIKMKYLFDVAACYGFNTNEYEERLFILHVFQLAFSSEETRRETLFVIENWEEEKKKLTDMDWRNFQQEYRDYIDFAKMLQLMPGIGAFVGAIANHNLLKSLGETAMNAYRMRILKKSPEQL
jgi:nitrate reductase alpha subunit